MGQSTGLLVKAKIVIGVCYLALYTQPLLAQAVDPVVITATRVPEPLDRLPAMLSVVSGRELINRNADDMAGALSLVAGAEAPSGGDKGPSSAVPSFWGLHEFDAFLLVVDGVPWGGAFNPAITTFNLTGLERLEVLKGSAPVMYGATSFVGVVQALHYPAGLTPTEALISYGTYGSLRGSASVSSADNASVRQSLIVSGESRGYADSREQTANAHLLYRGAMDVGVGQLRFDANVAHVHDVPTSPVPRIGAGLASLTPIDLNVNPADSRIDEDQYHFALGYTQATALGQWDTLVSFSHSNLTDIRGFLEPELTGAVDTQNQQRSITDGYLDTHFADAIGERATLVVGADLLYGHGAQTTLNSNGGYSVSLDGSVVPPPASSLFVNERGTIEDWRWFAGAYSQLDWKPDDHWAVITGLRVNSVSERKNASVQSLPDLALEAQRVSKSLVRPTETVGVSYRLGAATHDEVVIYADYRNAFKPSALDFGPDYTPDLLSPETATTYEFGVKGTAAQGRMSYQVAAFWLDFTNLVVATTSGSLANAGGETLRGFEGELRFALTSDLVVQASGAFHNARFSQYEVTDDATGNLVSVAGKQLTLAPRVLAGLGLMYAPSQGIHLAVSARYVGRRYLDEQNEAEVGGYTNIDASVGYLFGRSKVTLNATNLSNQRPPVTLSEFGSGSLYLLAGRQLWLTCGYRWR
jgi:iron complex outermembrane receptor protein